LDALGVADHDHAAGAGLAALEGQFRSPVESGEQMPTEGYRLNYHCAANCPKQTGLKMVSPPDAARKERRCGIERRQFSYAAHIPERRTRPERRQRPTSAKR
jgi:hypothetical protein